MLAQQDKNQVSISLGAASSLASTVLNLGGNENSSTTPAININADLGMNSKFSLGLTYCFQNFKTSNVAYSNYGGINYSYIINQNRHNAGVRFLFHFTQKKDIDFYSGLRLAYMFNDVKTDFVSSGSYYYNVNSNIIGGSKNRYTQQLVVGGKYYWNETFGVFSELGIGFPYAFNVGLGMRLN